MRFIKNLNILLKFGLVLAAFAILTVAAVVFSTTKMRAIDAGYSAASTQQGEAAFHMANASRAIVAAGRAIAGLVIATDADRRNDAIGELKESEADFQKSIALAKSSHPARADAYETIARLGSSLFDGPCAAAIRLGEGTLANPGAAQIEYTKTCEPAFDPVIDSIQKAAEEADDEQAKLNDALSAVTSQTIIITYAFVLGGLIVFGAAAFLAVRNIIANPLTAISATMAKLAKDDLSVVPEGLDRLDEIGLIARAVQVFKENAVRAKELELNVTQARFATERERGAAEDKHRKAAEEQESAVTFLGRGLDKISNGDMTTRLDEIFPEQYRQLQTDFNWAISQLDDAMAAVSGSVRSMKAQTVELSTASDNMSRRTEQQAAAVEETAATLNEITLAVRKTAESAVKAADVTDQARHGAEKSSDVVRQAVEAMGQIEQSSSKISEIIGVIDEIAFQTNLLALNAGVEAARAGEAGRGFAVVAQEVRGLAQRSAEAAREIKSLIFSSSSQVAHGVELVGHTGTALSMMAGQVAELTKLVGAIASSAQAQATGLNEVNTAVTQLDQVTQQNAAMVEESTAANKCLEGEAEELMKLMARFQTGSHAKATRAAQAVASHRKGGPGAVTTRPAVRQSSPSHAGGAARKLAVIPTADDWEEF